MTYGEAKAIIHAKIGEEDPLQFGNQTARIQNPEERIDAVVDEFKANTDLQSMRMDLLEEIYRALHEEAGISGNDLDKLLSDDTALSPRVEALVRKLDKFPFEGEYYAF